MDKYSAYYGIIQYMPDFSRMEGQNVGLIVLCHRKPFYKIKTVKTNDIFVNSVLDNCAVLFDKTEKTKEEMSYSMKNSGSCINFVDFRPFVLFEDVEVEFEEMFKELVLDIEPKYLKREI